MMMIDSWDEPGSSSNSGQRRSLLPGGLQSLESLFDASRQSHDLAVPYSSPHEHGATAVGDPEKWQQNGSASTCGDDMRDSKQSPSRQRIAYERATATGSRCSVGVPSRASTEPKHRRSATLASLATVATSGAQTVYEDAVEAFGRTERENEITLLAAGQPRDTAL